MAITIGLNLGNGVDLGVTSAEIYAVPTTLILAAIDQARLVNYGTIAVTVNLWILQSGETEANRFKAISSKRLSPNETYLCPEIIGDSINAGGSIRAICDTATSVSFSGKAREIT